MSNELKNTKLYKTDYLKNIHNYNSKCYKLTTVKFLKIRISDFELLIILHKKLNIKLMFP